MAQGTLSALFKAHFVDHQVREALAALFAGLAGPTRRWCRLLSKQVRNVHRRCYKRQP